MKKLTIILGLIAFGVIAQAAPQLYIRDGNTFKKVNKRQAVVALLQNSKNVYKCAPQELTDNMTMKNRTNY